jgi:hypothetical protein
MVLEVDWGPRPVTLGGGFRFCTFRYWFSTLLDLVAMVLVWLKAWALVVRLPSEDFSSGLGSELSVFLD